MKDSPEAEAGQALAQVDARRREAAQAAFHLAHDLVMVLDPTGRIEFASGSFLQRFGLTMAEALGLCAYDLVPDEFAQDRRAGVDRVVATGEVVILKGELDGRLVETHLCPIKDDAGEVLRVASFVHDITDRLEAQRALTVATESLGVPIWVSAVADGKILFANDALHELLELPLQSLLGQQTPNLYENPEERAAFVAELRDKGRVRNREVRIRLPDGRKRLIWASADMITMAGQPAMMGCFWDVTEQREAQERLRQAQKMEAMGRLAGGIAHDFNNLLTVIMGSAESLRRRNDSGGGPQLDDIMEAAGRAAELTRQLLAYGRQQMLRPEALDVNRSVAGLQAMLSRLIGEGVRLELRLADALDRVWADPSQIEQMVMNLVINGRDAVAGNGQVTVETANVAADAPELPPSLGGRACVRLSVRDDGEGIAPELLPKVFEPFFTTKSMGAGSGLGLATVQGVATQSGGEVTVDSEVGEGAVFHVWLPVADVADDAPEASGAVPAPDGARPTRSLWVLVAEDEVRVRRAVCQQLEAAGHRTLEADNGLRALEVAAAHDGPIDVLLSDVTMPQLDGRELARRFVEARPETRVLLMSGYAPEEEAEPVDGRRVSPPVLQKPFSNDELIASIDARLARPS